jgi:enolase-phosphatase E1
VTRPPSGAGTRALLLDIEGTTTPLAFVIDVLFPHAKHHLRRHVEQHGTSPEYSALFEQFHAEHARDLAAGSAVPQWNDAPPAARRASIVSYAEWLMDRDRKSTALKTLQGRIWKEGYERGELLGEVFDDVPRALERWYALELQIGIFSSGSVLAQQLLFRHSSAGDLTKFLKHYFDTTTGAKTDAESYRHIAVAMGSPARSVLFVSDVVSELDAAHAAGMDTRLSVRSGNHPTPHHAYTVIRTFDELDVPA